MAIWYLTKVIVFTEMGIEHETADSGRRDSNKRWKNTFGESPSGIIDTSAEEATREHIVGARFMSRDEISTHTVFPEVVSNRLWADLKANIPSPIYLGLREMEFY